LLGRGEARTLLSKHVDPTGGFRKYNPPMLLFRLGPDGAYAVEDEARTRFLYSDPFETRPGVWEYGREIGSGQPSLLPPVRPGKIVGIGRNYAEHAREFGNEVPDEPLVFLKSPGSVIGPKAPIVLPPESADVHFEGEIAVVLRARLTRASSDEARDAILGVTCANDVTARDLQRSDKTFARAKSFDTFCPLGPGILVGTDFDGLEVRTRVNGEERQRAGVDLMLWGIVDLVVYVSRMMTLESGDVILTGTPAGVGPLADGDTVEVEVPDVGILVNRVEARRGATGG
jgi:2-keto-4-pentenoate hydratase/2-oxohepta-3-ene-1,7-dioic acid hydratase in catechol pathway